ncbi:MAG: tail fiber domain-containing protein [Bacteroidota bacterium]
MKNVVAIVSFLVFPLYVFTQNIGIGTTKPFNKLQVMGSLVVGSTSISTKTPPTNAQTTTMSNGASVMVGLPDSTGRIYDPGGPAAGYINNLSSSVSILNNSSAAGIELIFEDFDLGTGDSLQVIGPEIYHNFSSNNPASGAYVVDAFSLVQIRFESNGDSKNGRGFAILWRYQYSDSAGKTPRMTGGPGLSFDVNTGAFRAGIPSSIEAGNASIAVGNRVAATGTNAFAAGHNSVASGSGSVAIGFESRAKGGGSIAIGNYALATGSGSIAISGSQSEASGQQSIAFGISTKASGLGATAMGKFSDATGIYATAMGLATEASGANSTAIGYVTKSQGFAGTAIGMYNDPIVGVQTAVSTNTPLFIIGNGEESLRSNAIVVLKSGNVGIGTNTPRAKFHVNNGTDATYTDESGYAIFGSVSSSNLVIDNNEILARNNGAASNLNLQGAGGRVVIGSAGGMINTSNILDVNGSAGKPSGASWSTFSDERLKQGITPYAGGMKEIMKINPVWFHYNNLSGFDPGPRYVGILAQELQLAAPYMVTPSPSIMSDGSSGYLQVNNSAMVYMLVNAVKEQQKQLEDMKNTYESEHKILKARIQVLEKK